MNVTREEETLTTAVATAWESAQILAVVVAPTVAMGTVKRRPWAMRVGQALHIDRIAIRWLQRIRRYRRCDALLVRLPGRTLVVVLHHRAVSSILDETSIFTPDTHEKHAALVKFQPHGALITRGPIRSRLRDFNEAALQIDEPIHELAGPVSRLVYDETQALMSRTLRTKRCDWTTFEEGWWKTVRSVVFGPHAKRDTDAMDTLDRLRRSANWSYLTPRKWGRRDELGRRLQDHMAAAEKGSLAAYAQEGDPGNPDAWHQVAHWLFAFDAAGMATYRTLALLASHPRQRELAVSQASARPLWEPQTLPYLRASVEESLRLWPTTPFLLRDTTQALEWGSARVPAGTAFVIYTPLFHRDRERLGYADAFVPDAWLDGRARSEPGIVPFSSGPERCPGRNVVLLVSAEVLATMLCRAEFVPLRTPNLGPDAPLPATLDPFGIRFAVAPLVDNDPAAATGGDKSLFGPGQRLH